MSEGDELQLTKASISSPVYQAWIFSASLQRLHNAISVPAEIHSQAYRSNQENPFPHLPESNVSL